MFCLWATVLVVVTIRVQLIISYIGHPKICTFKLIMLFEIVGNAYEFYTVIYGWARLRLLISQT